jgi:hypothetical protein
MREFLDDFLFGIYVLFAVALLVVASVAPLILLMWAFKAIFL